MTIDVLPPVDTGIDDVDQADTTVEDTVIDLQRAAELILAHRTFICLRELPDHCDTHITADTLASTITRQTGETRQNAHARIALLVRGLRLVNEEALFVLEADDGVVLQD